MSAIDVQLRFAAEFALFLVALAGVGFAFLRADLLVVRPLARAASTVGFASLAVASLLSGALIVDDPSSSSVVALRAAGIVLLAVSSLSWRADRRGRDLLRIGLLALLAAEVVLATDEDANRLIDVAHFIGAIAIGACLVGASARVISARIAASGAMILFAVITVVAVALSAVVSDNIEDEALRRYSSRATAEAVAAAGTAEAILPSVNLIARVLESASGEDTQVALRRVTGRVQASPGEIEAARALMVRTVQLLADRFVQDARSGPTLIVLDDVQGSVVAEASPGSEPQPDPLLFAADLGGRRVVDVARNGTEGAQSVAVVAGFPMAVGGTPLSVDGVRVGVLLRTSLLDDTYLGVRLNPIANEQPGAGIAFATRDEVLAADGAVIDPDTVTQLAAAAVDATPETARITSTRFLVSAPVLDEDGDPVMAVVLSVPRAEEDATREDLYRVLFVVAMGAATAALLLAGLAGERIGSGLRRLTAAATAIEAGDLEARVGVTSDDELGALGATFDSMARSLHTMTADLRTAAVDEATLRGRLEAVVGGMGEALIAVDADGIITDFNTAAEELFDLPGQDARGHAVADIVELRSEDGSDVSPRLGRPIARAWSATGTIVLSGGEEIPVVLTAGTLRGPGNEVNGAVFVVRDERRERELERMKTEFLSNISHELRTPLTPIKGFASLLQTRELPAKQTKGFADEISNAADQLERVIGQLVNFSTVVGGRLTLDPEPLSVRPLLDEVLKRWRGQITTPHKLVRRVQAGVPQLLADRAFLAQSLDELIDNAIKYSPDGGRIVVGAAVVDGAEGPAMELSVTDQGVGIPADRLESIVHDFTQGDASATRQFGGLGLGLALVHRIARAHGGELLVESTPGKGSRLAMVLPLDGPYGGAR